MNDDLISRQAAIDAVMITPQKWDGMYIQDLNCRLRDTLNALPFVQPETIRCKDCKWFGEAGCAVLIVDDSDKPTEDDYCSFAERRTDE